MDRRPTVAGPPGFYPQGFVVIDNILYFGGMKHDLDVRDDVERLVDLFYAKVQKDPLLAPVFVHVDWPEHLPKMYNFWASMMLGEMTYRGNPFENHIRLPIGTEHFNQWLELFTATVDENFEGARAVEIKERARSIAEIFQYKMGLIKRP